MPALLTLSLVIQLAFVAHVYRSGAPRYWVLVILALPVAGCLAYWFLQVFPRFADARWPAGAAHAPGHVHALRDKAERLVLCGSVDNRVALAEECLAAGLLEEAVMLYRSSAAGAYENDPHLVFGLARALVEHGAWDDAADAVGRLRRDHPCHRANETRLLHVRVLESTGETDAALAEYDDLAHAFVGFEARYRHALLLDRLGRRDESRALLAGIVAQAHLTPPALESEARWARLARERLV